MVALFRALCLLFIAASTAAYAAANPTWVLRSNQIAQPVLQELGHFLPEVGSAEGNEEFDSGIVDLMPRV
jgi:hypothetical protein